MQKPEIFARVTALRNMKSHPLLVTQSFLGRVFSKSILFKRVRKCMLNFWWLKNAFPTLLLPHSIQSFLLWTQVAMASSFFSLENIFCSLEMSSFESFLHPLQLPLMIEWRKHWNFCSCFDRRNDSLNEELLATPYCFEHVKRKKKWDRGNVMTLTADKSISVSLW